MSQYDIKRAPSAAPSYLSQTPSRAGAMPGPPYVTDQTPYEQELDSLGGRTGAQPRGIVDEPQQDHQAWKYGADTYFHRQPEPPAGFQKVYRIFCCGSVWGCLIWLLMVLLLLIGLVVGLVFATRRRDDASPSAAIVQAPVSAVSIPTTVTATVTIPPSLFSHPASTVQASTLTTVSISTFYSSPPSTVTATSVTTAVSITTEKETQTTQVVSTSISVLSGTIITLKETEIMTKTDTATITATTVTVSVSTQQTTIPTTILTTATTTSVSTSTFTPFQASTVTTTATTTSVSTTRDTNRIGPLQNAQPSASDRTTESVPATMGSTDVWVDETTTVFEPRPVFVTPWPVSGEP